MLGFILGAVALSIHFDAAGSQSAFGRFCHVSAELSCDAVLGSSWAKFLGIPVAGWAALAFLTSGVLAWSLGTSAARERARRARMLLAVAVAMTVVAAYFLIVSVAAIGVGCPICLSMDATIVAHLAVVVALVRSLPAAGAAGTVAGWAGGGAMAGVLAAVVLYLAQTAGGGLPTGPLSIADIRRADPRFYAYYVSQPVVAIEGIEPADDPTTTLTVVEFSDFECPHCRRAFFDLEQVIAHSGDGVRLVHRNFPLSRACNDALEYEGHEHACSAALASICAERQGRGPEYERLLFANQPNLKRAELLAYAGTIALDVKALEVCLDSPEAKARLASDIKAARAAGVESTPTLFFNGRRVQGGFQNLRQYLYALEIERARRTQPATP